MRISSVIGGWNVTDIGLFWPPIGALPLLPHLYDPGRACLLPFDMFDPYWNLLQQMDIK